MKIIVSHFSPDIDSICASWLVARFMPGFSQAEMRFVAAGKTYEDMPVDSNPDIIHVDTGFGKFDHHQNNDYTCASLKVFEYLKIQGFLKLKYAKTLERITRQVNEFDHFMESSYPEPNADRYEFMIHKIIEAGMKNIIHDDLKILEHVFIELDSLFIIFLKKIQAEEEIKKGYVFQSNWGRTLVLESKNEETMKLALKSGFELVAKKNPEKGNLRIKTLPGKKYDLKKLHDKIVKEDKKGTWFFHASGNMLLNSSSKNPNFIASPITTKRLIEIIKSI